MEWYVAFVETGKEEYVRRHLTYHFNSETLRTLIPKRKLREKKNNAYVDVFKNLFPGYIFVYTIMDLDKYKIINSLPCVIRVLKNDLHCAPVNDSEMNIILKLVGDSDIIDYSRITIVNSKVTIVDGPLYGIEGIIKKINKHTKRAKVLLNFLGEPRLIDIGLEILHNSD